MSAELNLPATLRSIRSASPTQTWRRFPRNSRPAGTSLSMRQDLMRTAFCPPMASILSTGIPSFVWYGISLVRDLEWSGDALLGLGRNYFFRKTVRLSYIGNSIRRLSYSTLHHHPPSHSSPYILPLPSVPAARRELSSITGMDAHIEGFRGWWVHI